MPYATVPDIQRLIPIIKFRITDTSIPSDGDVEAWIAELEANKHTAEKGGLHRPRHRPKRCCSVASPCGGRVCLQSLGVGFSSGRKPTPGTSTGMV